jgi:hypothetical protein
MDLRLRKLISRRASRGLLGGGLGFLVGVLLSQVGGFESIWGLDASSWADGLPGPLAGLFGGGAAGAAPKGRGSSGPGGRPKGPDASEPPILRNPPDNENPPGLAPEDETSYGMFEGIQDLLGKVLGEDYEGAKDRFKEVQRGGDWLGGPEPKDEK